MRIHYDWRELYKIRQRRDPAPGNCTHLLYTYKFHGGLVQNVVFWTMILCPAGVLITTLLSKNSASIFCFRIYDVGAMSLRNVCFNPRSYEAPQPRTMNSIYNTQTCYPKRQALLPSPGTPTCKQFSLQIFTTFYVKICGKFNFLVIL